MLIDAVDTARDAQRLAEIVGVLVRHGFGDTVRRLGLADLLAKAGHALHLDHVAELARHPPPVQVRLAMEELGPTFVKLGQILAGRADLFGPEWLAEFEKLHSRVPPVPLAELRPQLREDLGAEPEEVFAWFDADPLAGGSIAQVHRARLVDGAEVVVKIRRPGIQARIDADLRLLGRLGDLAETHLPAIKPYGPRRMVQEFARSLRRELDLATECRSAERIARNLAALPFVSIPRVHWDYTRERINVQDYVDGMPGEPVARLREAGLEPALLARRGARAVVRMIVEDGFFHADPHPGNVFYLPGNRLVFIDFGMVGRLSEARREEVLQLLLGLVERQAQPVVDVLLDWAGDAQVVDAVRLEGDIEAFVDQYHGMPLAELDLAGMLGDVTAILREHRLALPSDLALMIKAFISLEGMGRALDPGFRMAAEAMPILRDVTRARYRPAELGRRASLSVRRMLLLGRRLPQDIANLLRSARRGRLHVGIAILHLKRVGDQIDRAASRVAIALVISALIVGSSIVMTVSGGPTLLGLPMFGFLGFWAAVAGGVWLVQSIRRGGRDDD